MNITKKKKSANHEVYNLYLLTKRKRKKGLKIENVEMKVIKWEWVWNDKREYFLQLKAKSLAKLLQLQSQRKYNYHHHQGENLWPQYFTSYPLKKRKKKLWIIFIEWVTIWND